MDDNCKDCIQVQNLRTDVDRLRSDVKDIYERLGEVESFKASGGEQIKMIFKILNEIKDSIKDISSKLETIEKKPSDNYEKIKLAIITAITSSCVTALIAFLISKIK